MTQQGDSLSKELQEQPETGAGSAQTAEEILETVTQDLASLHQGLIAQLSQEVAQLQEEKTRLMSDLEQLRQDYQALQSRQLETLSEQQMIQQQVWAKQLAEVLANHLQALLIERLNQAADSNQLVGTSPIGPAPSALSLTSDHHEHAYPLLAALDTSFGTTFKALQTELSSYQSALSQQLQRMQSMEEQGEAILAALVGYLREQLHQELSETSAHPDRLLKDRSYPTTLFERLQSRSTPSLSSSAPIAKPIPLEFPGAPLPLPRSTKDLSQFQKGFLLVLLSTVALSFHNVVVRVIGSQSSVLGLFQMGGFIKLGLGNSLLILWLRMLVVLPLMVPVAMFLYPPVWKDIKQFLMARDRRPLFNVVGSGGFLFLSQILIYIAIGQIGPGVAVTILFMYPIVTVPLAWLLFRDRPTWLRWAVMITISLGVIFTALPSIDPSKVNSGTGVLTAIGSGIAFAFYLIFMQLGFKKLHPIPVSLIQFFTIFLLSSTSLILPIDLGVRVNQTYGFIVGGLILGALTLVGYLANNFGVRYMGAARASIVASSGPVMTALLAFLLIQSPLRSEQIFGIFLVTAGVAALSFERMKDQTTASKSAK